MPLIPFLSLLQTGQEVIASMWTYISRRLIQALFILLIITGVCFLLTHFSADPMSQYANRQGMTAADRAAIAHSLGLDQPLPVQYVKWLWLALHGNLGDSFFSRQPVLTLIGQRLPLTLDLMVTAEVFIIIISLILGTVSAVKQYSALDNIITSFSFIGYSMPIFFIALGLMQIFAVQFKAWDLPYLPTGADIWDPKDLGALAWHMVLPVTCLVIIQVAGYSRFLRSSILEVLGLDYIRTARAKGLSERTMLYQACPAQCNPALHHHHRPGYSLPAGRGAGDRVDFRLARHGPPVLGICPAR